MPKITKKGNYKFSQDEIYNAHYHMAKFNLDLLKQFQKMEKAGYPGYDEASTPEEWQKLIDSFVLTFQRIVDDFDDSPMSLALKKMRKENPKYDKIKTVKLENGCYTDAPEKIAIMNKYVTEKVKKEERKYTEEIETNLQLFAKYFNSIWD